MNTSLSFLWIIITFKLKVYHRLKFMFFYEFVKVSAVIELKLFLRMTSKSGYAASFLRCNLSKAFWNCAHPLFWATPEITKQKLAELFTFTNLYNLARRDGTKESRIRLKHKSFYYHLHFFADYQSKKNTTQTTNSELSSLDLTFLTQITYCCVFVVYWLWLTATVTKLSKAPLQRAREDVCLGC
jgi:hypothetical protein